MTHHKRKADPNVIPVADENDTLRITALGAGNEVGRSCHVLRYKGKTIMLDAGLHPAYSGHAALPFFDEIDPSTIDVLLVTHFHLDHAAALPYFMEKTTFKGRVFMTHPTKAIYKWMLTDYVKVSNVSVEEMLYDEQDLLRSFERIEVIDYHQELEVEGIRFTAYVAGHVLGAAMFLVEVAGVKVLYTGDYSREEDRHLMAAEIPEDVHPDVLMCESTYGVQSHESRYERETRFTTLVHDIVQRGGRCLLPVFALGRAQELLLILDEYWEAHPELESIPIYYASALAKKCMAVYQTYINMMNEKIRKQFAVSNPFVFKHISNLKNMENFDDVGACVMMASPGMLQNGLSRDLFERWCTDKRNGVVVTGYCVDGTLAKHILSEPPEVQSLSGTKLPLRMSVDYISFSAHVDYTQNSQFIEEVKAPHLVLVHGDSNAMGRLKSALQSKFAEKEENIQIYTPKNCETITLYFRGEKMAKIMGRLANAAPVENSTLSGILVAKDFEYHIMAAEDLNQFTDLKTSTIEQTQTISYSSSFSLLKYHLEMMYGSVEVGDVHGEEKDSNSGKRNQREEMTPKGLAKEINGEGISLKVFDAIYVTKISRNQLKIQWIGNSVNDMIADSVLAVVLNIEGSPASIKLTHQPHSHGHGGHDHDHESKSQAEDLKESTLPNPEEDKLEYMNELSPFLKLQFGDVKADPEALKFTVRVDDAEAIIDCELMEIETSSETLQKRISTILSHANKTIRPLSYTWNFKEQKVQSDGKQGDEKLEGGDEEVSSKEVEVDEKSQDDKRPSEDGKTEEAVTKVEEAKEEEPSGV